MCYGSFDPTFYFRSSMGAAGFSDGSSPLHISSWAAAFSLLGGIDGAGGSLMGMIERRSLLPSFTCLFLLVCYPFPALIPPKVCSIAISRIWRDRCVLHEWLHDFLRICFGGGFFVFFFAPLPSFPIYDEMDDETGGLIATSLFRWKPLISSISRGGGLIIEPLWMEKGKGKDWAVIVEVT